MKNLHKTATALLIAFAASTAFANTETGNAEATQQAQEQFETKKTVTIPVEIKKQKEVLVYTANTPFEYINGLAKKNGYKTYWRAPHNDKFKLKADLKNVFTANENWLTKAAMALNEVNLQNNYLPVLGNTLHLNVCNKNTIVVSNPDVLFSTDKQLAKLACNRIEALEQVKYFVDQHEVNPKEFVEKSIAEEHLKKQNKDEYGNPIIKEGEGKEGSTTIQKVAPTKPAVKTNQPPAQVSPASNYRF